MELLGSQLAREKMKKFGKDDTAGSLTGSRAGTASLEHRWRAEGEAERQAKDTLL